VWFDDSSFYDYFINGLASIEPPEVLLSVFKSSKAVLIDPSPSDRPHVQSFLYHIFDSTAGMGPFDDPYLFSQHPLDILNKHTDLPL
jgi:hypothetical protein